jgi:hypothetical protein
LIRFRQFPNADVAKGKMVSDHSKGFGKQKQAATWEKKETP